jgi:hypothetical protein
MRAALTVTLIFASASASADVYIDVHPQPSGPPTLETLLIDEQQLPASDIALESTTSEFAPIPATNLRDFAHGPDALAIAFVIQGSEVFAGNEEIDRNPNDVYTGMLAPLEVGLRGLDLPHFAPADSQVAVIEYDSGAGLRVPMEPLAHFTPEQLGSEHDYYRKIGTDLVSGIELGLSELGRTHAAVKLLVVIGDGSDTNNEVAKVELARLRKVARSSHIELASIVWKSALSEPESVITTFVPGSRQINSREAIGVALRDALAHIASRRYMTFSGATMRWDGKSQSVAVRLGHTLLDDVELGGQSYRTPTTSRWWRAWWAQLAAGCLFVALLMLGVKLSDR